MTVRSSRRTHVFHTILVRAAGNEMLARTYETLRARQVVSGLVALRGGSAGRREAVLTEHEAIVAALAAGDPGRHVRRSPPTSTRRCGRSSRSADTPRIREPATVASALHVRPADPSGADSDRFGPRARMLIGAATGQLTELIVTFDDGDRHRRRHETAG
ncbi:FCD domain-containing protein [Kutzneria kofuensis]|uniref:FCD domain-containing protein n=1 Tax=Kutzneria kofuensis TaxID=103725 RepID=UPI0031E5D98D